MFAGLLLALGEWLRKVPKPSKGVDPSGTEVKEERV